MPYNRGMKQITLVLPFALPAPELAPDLMRALPAPALAALVSRSAAHQRVAFDGGTRHLPHELWLADAMGLAGPAPAPDAAPAFARAVMRGMGIDEPDGTWFIVNPVHVQIARNHLLMSDQRRVRLSGPDARALFDAARPYFDESGKPLLYGDAENWFVRADDWAGLRTASPDAAAGQNLNAWMPEGGGELACRKLQNEVQMLWFEHPVNLAREARGEPAINAFWLWGGAAATAISSPGPAGELIAAIDAPAWMQALAGARTATSTSTAASVMTDPRERALVLSGSLIEASLASDWAAWLARMQRLEHEWFAPLLAALKSGRIDRVTLVLNHRDAYAQLTATTLSQRKFWRRPTLNRLLP
jgi:hypothetical protein